MLGHVAVKNAIRRALELFKFVRTVVDEQFQNRLRAAMMRVTITVLLLWTFVKSCESNAISDFCSQYEDESTLIFENDFMRCHYNDKFTECEIYGCETSITKSFRRRNISVNTECLDVSGYNSQQPKDLIEPNSNFEKLRFAISTSLESKSISNFANLREIRVERAWRLRTKAVADLPRLERIEFTNIDVHCFPVNTIHNTSNLKEIIITNSHVEHILSHAFYSQLAVERLAIRDVVGLSIGRRPFAGMRSLNHLEVSGAEVNEFGCHWLTHLSSLKTINFSHNDLSQLKRKYFPSTTRSLITNLDFSFNSLEVIDDDAFDNLDKLEVLNLSHNHLDAVPDSVFAMRNLKVLDLTNNRIRSLSPELEILVKEGIARVRFGPTIHPEDFINISEAVVEYFAPGKKFYSKTLC